MDLGDAGLALPLLLLGLIGGALVPTGSGGTRRRRAGGHTRALAATTHVLEGFEPGPILG
jgi:hypothetical protein